MIARLAIVIVGVIAIGCSAPPPAAPTVANSQVSPVRPTPAGCPVLGFHGQEWLHEVFPGCPAMPFQYPFQVCVGECPRPRRARALGALETYDYDANGQWMATRYGDQVTECALAGGRIASCGDGYAQWQRRADGRLVAIVTGSRRELWMGVTYDEHGDTREVRFPGFEMIHRFTYDAEHRMLEHRQIDAQSDEVILAFTYKAGLLVSRETPIGRRAFTYDARGRLIRAADVAGPGVDVADYNDVVTLSYDEQDRVVKIVEDPRKYGGPLTTEYDY